MKLQMIGTGSVSAKQRSACCLIDERLLVDCGNGIVKTLQQQNINIHEIDTLLITHNHGDHMLDVPFLILLRSFTPMNNVLRIYCPRDFGKVVHELVGLVYSDIVGKWNDIVKKARVEFEEFEDLCLKGEYAIKSVLVDHGETKPCYGYMITHNDKTIGISGDSSLCEGVEHIVQTSDVSVLDASFLRGNRSHMGLDSMIYLSEKYHKKIILTHMNEETRKAALEMDSENLIVPDDSMILEL